MANIKPIKHNKIVSRSIIIAGTVLAGLGIFVAVNHAALPATASASAPVASNPAAINTNFSTTDAFLTQSSGISSGQTYSAQTAPASSSRVRTRGS